MNLILSIFLCFALALSGTGTLPAEPETATTWTIRNVVLDTGDETFALNPEVHITTAVGTDKAVMHFEVENGGKVLMPVSTEIKSDELRLALSNGGNAYSLSEAEFAELLDLDDETAQVLDILGGLYINYGKLLGTVLGDEKLAEHYGQTMIDVIIKACGKEFVPVEIELDGETVSAQQAELDLTFESCFALLDAMRSCGMPEMEEMMDALLSLCNLAADETYADFAGFAEEIDEEDVEFSMPMTITLSDDLTYGLVEGSADMDGITMNFREEVVEQGEDTTFVMSMRMDGGMTDAVEYVVSAQITGPMTAPTAVHADYEMIMDSSAMPLDGGMEMMFSNSANMRMVVDATEVDGLGDAQLTIDYVQTTRIEREGTAEEYDSGVQFVLTTSDRLEADESVTTSVTMSASVDDENLGLSFELNCSRGAFVDYFDGLNEYELTAEALNVSDEDLSGIMATFASDALRLSADAMQLASDESVMALINAFNYEDSDEYDYYDSEYEDVETLEEASEIFAGEVPNFTPPEGYEIEYITVSPDELYVVFASEDDYFSMDAYYSPNELEISEGVTQLSINGHEIELYEYEDGEISVAALPDGDLVLYFYFSDSTTSEMAAELLAGLN